MGAKQSNRIRTFSENAAEGGKGSVNPMFGNWKIKSVEGMAANSNSPVDIYIIERFNNITGEELKSVVKLWISPSKIKKSNYFKKNVEALDYEAKIYEKIQDFDDGIKGNFIEIIDFKTNRTKDEVLNDIFYPVFKTKNEREIISRNFDRNVAYMYCGGENRPSVTEEGESIECKLPRKLTYDYIETVYAENSITLKDYIQRFNDNKENSKDSKEISKIYKILLTLVLTVFKMNKYGIYHNDLHFGNIFVNKDTGDIKIYDFDHAYYEDFGENPLSSKEIKRGGKVDGKTLGLGSEITSIISKKEPEYRDLIKIFCHISSTTLDEYINIDYSTGKRLTKNEIANIVFKKIPKYIDSSYPSGIACIWQKKYLDMNEFNTPIVIVNKFICLLLQKKILTREDVEEILKKVKYTDVKDLKTTTSTIDECSPKTKYAWAPTSGESRSRTYSDMSDTAPTA